MDIRELRVVVRAKNFDRTCRFYEDVLGMPRLDGWERDTGRGALFQAGETVLEILGRPAGQGTRGWDEDFDYQGPDHKLALTIVVPSAQKVYEELYLRDKNIPGGLREDVDGTLLFGTHDPDGVHIVFRQAPELAAERARELSKPSAHGPQQEHGGTLGAKPWADADRT